MSSLGNLLTNIKLEENQNVNTDSTRIVKFEVLIKDIDNALELNRGMGAIAFLTNNTRREAQSALFSPLDIIFKRDSLNIYGRIIMQNATIEMPWPEYADTWYKQYSGKNFNSEQTKYSAAKDFIKHLRESNLSYIRYQKYIFIFWGLMVLSVDETDADEKLSLICDFAKMLQITDDELIDIANIIKLIYHDTNERYAFKSASTSYVFEKLVATQHLSALLKTKAAVEE